MGLNRENGYSASVEAFLLVAGLRLRVAKTNGVDFVLAEFSDVAIPPATPAELLIIIDGDGESHPITLPQGITPGQRTVRYEDIAVPF